MTMPQPEPMQVRVLLADDHAQLRAAVRDDLQDAGFDVCAEAATADDAFDAAMRERPDVCLLDVRMPGGGIDAAARISGALPETRVAMLTVCRDDATVAAAVEAGATGFLMKDLEADHLAHCLHRVAAGEHVLPRALR